MDSLLRNFFPITLAVFFGGMLAIFAYTRHEIPPETEDLVYRFTTAQENLDYNALKKNYASNAIMKFERIRPDGASNKYFEANAHHVIDLAKKTKSAARRLNDYSEYSDIEYEWLDDNIRVSSIRLSHKTGRKTPHILILSQDKKKNWWIMEEYIIEYAHPTF